MMKKIEYIKGDLFQTPHKVIVHGCNDLGVMGSGVAKIVRDNYPEAYEKYMQVYEKEGLEGGTIIPAFSNGKVIVNAISQYGYGRSGRFVNYEWIAAIFAKLNVYCSVNAETHIAMPQIGAGLGGGSWEVISAIIESEAKSYTPVVYIL